MQMRKTGGPHALHGGAKPFSIQMFVQIMNKMIVKYIYVSAVDEHI